MPYGDESWENYRRTMYWFNPKVSLASRLAFNFAGQTLDFLKHREDYQMVIAKLLNDIFWVCQHARSCLAGHNI